MDLDEPIMFRIQCVKCNVFLSMPFKLTAESNEVKGQIKIPRYKGDNLNYHIEEDLSNSGKILYSFIFCLSCHEKVGYWISQASKREEKNINQIFLFRKCINLIRYYKNSVSEEEDRKFQQEEAFYNSEYLTDEVINYAKEHIDNFINNLKKLVEWREEARHCYDSIDGNILYLKDLFVKIMQGEIKEPIKLDFNSSKEETSDAKKRNRLRIKNYESNKNEQEEDSKSEERKVNKNEEETEQNGQNIINNEQLNNNNIINQDDNGNDKNGEDIENIDDLGNNLKSDIHIDEKIKQKNIEQTGQNIINNEQVNNNIINQDDNGNNKNGEDIENIDDLVNYETPLQKNNVFGNITLLQKLLKETKEENKKINEIKDIDVKLKKNIKKRFKKDMNNIRGRIVRKRRYNIRMRKVYKQRSYIRNKNRKKKKIDRNKGK